MSISQPHPDRALNDEDFEALARGELGGEALQRLRLQVQAALDAPDEGIDHETLWADLESRIKRAALRAA